MLAGHDATVGITITTPDQRLAALWEPGCASNVERWKIIDEARRLGLATSVMFGPLLPLLSDGRPTSTRCSPKRPRIRSKPFGLTR